MLSASPKSNPSIAPSPVKSVFIYPNENNEASVDTAVKSEALISRHPNPSTFVKQKGVKNLISKPTKSIIFSGDSFV